MDKIGRKIIFEYGGESINYKLQKLDIEEYQKQNYCENESTPQSKLPVCDNALRNLGSTTPVKGNSTNIAAAQKTRRSLFPDDENIKRSVENILMVTQSSDAFQTIPLSPRSPPNYRNDIQDLSTQELHDYPISIQRTTENQALVFLKRSNALKMLNTDSGKVTDTFKNPKRVDQVAVDPKTGNTIASVRNSIGVLNLKDGVVTLKEICTASSEVSCIAVNGKQQIITGNVKSQRINLYSDVGGGYKSTNIKQITEKLQHLCGQPPKKIVVNHNTDQVAILYDNKVIVVDKDWKQIDFQENFQGSEKLLTADFDSRNDLLVSTGHEIYILSTYDGRPQRKIELDRIIGFDVDCMAIMDHDLIWIGSSQSSSIKLISYRDSLNRND